MIDLATLNGRGVVWIIWGNLKVTLVGVAGLGEGWSRRPDLNQEPSGVCVG